jgi:hypothetical protein
MNYKGYQKHIPEDFKSDGCTLAPDGKWKQCCILHDYARQDKNVTDAEADKMLYNCMRDHANLPMAVLYYVWTRIQSITKASPIGLAMLAVFFVVIGILIYASMA